MSYLVIPDTKDWKFDGKDFTICGFWDKDEKGKYKFNQCSCKDWTKCKGFKNEKNK